MKSGKIGCLSVVGLVFVAVGARVIWGNVTPAIRVPGPPPLPVPNAFDTYQAAEKRLKRDKDISDALFNAQGKPRKPAAWASRAVLLSENAETLRLVRSGLAQPYRQPPIRNINEPFPYLKAHRNLARLLALEADTRFANGDPVGGATSCMDGIAFGKQIAGGGPLITRLVSIACQAITRRPLWANLNRLDARVARQSARRLETLSAGSVPMAETWTEEKYGLQTLLDETWRGTSPRVATPPTNDEDMDWRPPAPLLLYSIWPKKQIYANVTAYMDALVARSQKSGAERGPVPETPRDIWSRVLTPVLVKGAHKQLESEDTQNALLTASLALRAHRAQHGTYPAALSEVVKAGYLSRVPSDPFAFAAAPLRYRRTGANAYVLYSIGPDGRDDNGKAIDKPDPAAKSENARYFVEPDSQGDVVAGVNVY